LAHAVLDSVTDRTNRVKKSLTTTKTTLLSLAMTFVCVAALAAPVAITSRATSQASPCTPESGSACGASATVYPVASSGVSMLLGSGKAGFVVTDPGTLMLLGATLVSVGVWTRRLLFDKREL
jgi:hypothetical protein